MTWVYFTYREALFIELADGVKHGKVMISPKELADNDTARLAEMLSKKFSNLARELRELKPEGG